MIFNKTTICLVLVVILDLFLIGKTQAQIREQEYAKYWFYRHRLRTEFLIMGLSETQAPMDRATGFGGRYGHSIPAHNANANHQGEIKWSDATIDLGFYIGVLATEYKILKDARHDTSHTLEELFYACKAYERLDAYSNNLFNGSVESLQNGFFIRDDVTSDIYDENPVFEKYKNSSGRYVTQTDYLEFQDKPVGEVKTITPEQFHSLLLGFTLIKKCVGNDTYNGFQFKNSVMNYAETTAKYLEDRKWKVKNENGDATDFKSVFRGGHAWITAKAVGYLSDRYSSREFIDELTPFAIADFKSRLAFLRKSVALLSTYTIAHMGIGTALGDPRPTESFLKKLQQRTISIGPVTKTFVDMDIYFLLWNFLRDKNGSVGDPENMDDKLKDAPCYGLMWRPSNLEPGHPYYEGVNGWRSDNRWVKASQRFLGDRPSKMNGLDYMLLYNLYILYYGEHNPELVGDLPNMTPGAFPLNFDQPANINSNIYAYNEVNMTSGLTLNQDTEVLGDIRLGDGFHFKATSNSLRLLGGPRNACGDILDQYGDFQRHDHFALFPPTRGRSSTENEASIANEKTPQNTENQKSGYVPLGDYLKDRKAEASNKEVFKAPITEDSRVYVYPNPAVDEVNISFSPVKENVAVEIIDLNGKLLMKQSIIAGTNRTTIKIPSQTQKGVCFVRLTFQNKTIVKKLIIE